MTIAQMMDSGHTPFDYADYVSRSKTPVAAPAYYMAVGLIVGARSQHPALSYEEAYDKFTKDTSAETSTHKYTGNQSNCCGGGKER